MISTALAAWSSAAASQANVSNIAPRVDSATGEILDIHDGTTLRIGDTFYWYGAGYGGCTEQATGCANSQIGHCGFQMNHTVNVASSTNLVNWTFEGTALTMEDRPEGVLFSPWVARSNETGLYVMWTNVLPVTAGVADFQKARYTVATSVSPAGPFKTVVENVTGLVYGHLPDAASILFDAADGAGYVLFTHETSHINHVQKLTGDLLGPVVPSQVSEQVGPGGNEGAVLFQRNGLYYAAYGACCCFCGAGADVTYYVSSNPLGPYALGGTIVEAADWHAQTGSIYYTGADWVLYGDRYQSAPDHIKGHDFSYMTPLAFDDAGVIAKLSWQDSVLIEY